MAKLKNGEEITINIPDENWDWGYRPFEKQKGIKGVFLGYDEITYKENNPIGMKPGVYENVCWAKVKVADKTEIINSHFIEGATTFDIDGDYLREICN